MSSTWETFPNAPIVEAILDLRVELARPIEAQVLEQCFLDTHPQREELVEGTTQFQVCRAGVATNTSHGPIGFRFWSSDRTRLAQARVNGFTVNHLRPYNDWATLCAEGRALWQRYVQSSEPRSVVRVALRYVNCIAIAAHDNPSEYFNIGVRLDGNLGKAMPLHGGGYNVQLSCTDESRRAQAVIRNYSEPTGARDDAGHILDIDVFRNGSFAPDGEEVWDILKDLRDMKNELFFAATTEKAKETFRG